MNSLTIKFLAALIAVLMVTVIGSQLYYIFNEKHDTEEAVITTVNENISFDGVVVRNETVLNYNGSGVIDYLLPDGSKVKTDDVVAQVYNNEDQILAKKKAADLTVEIDKLSKAQNPGTTNFIQPEAIKNKINSQYKQMLTGIAKGNYSELGEMKSDLSMTMNIYDIVTKSQTGFDSRMNQLKAEKDKQTAAASSPTGTIKTTQTGYFVSSADGYETELSIDKLDSITPQRIKEIVDAAPKRLENAVGKIFDNYSCKIVGVLKNDKRIVEGVDLKLAMSASKSLYVVHVDSVKPVEDDNIMVVMSCDRLDEELAATRVASSLIVFDEYTGVRVPRKAIRFNGEQKGVYVIVGKDIVFKKIDVIYEGDDFVLSKNTDDQEYLLVFDQILLENVDSSKVSTLSPKDSSSNSDESNSSKGKEAESDGSSQK
ncbi:HlyD family efflux transporter periplasmic adaptor subunit [Ruminococcus sp. FC2018]|uniref:HlyD family efflux transporter periplasmic adaptor subunit n=1 Tax=Ruminococcus sp. FC2018 TaxID=1410617 RepID=UPI00068882A7|nr:HlyD family efflux transporter periplasmic adaptor subunit [Ruminococcus sp. FC2018]